MMRTRDPRRTKDLELTREHRVLTRKGNKTFRKSWPGKKARLNRAVRRAESMATSDPAADGDAVQSDVVVARSRHTRRLEKEGVVTVAEAIELKKDPRTRWSTALGASVNKERRAARGHRAKSDLTRQRQR